MVVLSRNDGLELEQWLPVLAALPLCHSLGLYLCGLDGCRNGDDAFDVMAVRSGLATSLALRLVSLEYGRPVALPALAAERAAHGLPCVVTRTSDDERLKLTATAPRACFGQCALLPSPHVHTGPSVKRKLCPASRNEWPNEQPPRIMDF